MLDGLIAGDVSNGLSSLICKGVKLVKERGEDSQESKPGVTGSQSSGGGLGSWTTQMLFPFILDHQLNPNLFQQALPGSDLEYLTPAQASLGDI